MYDSIIIGAGPAGISAGIYAKRAGLNVKIFYHGESQLEKAHKIDNYYGFENGITGKDLYEAGIKQALNLGIEVSDEEVLDVTMKDINLYGIKTMDGEYETKTIIFATGDKKIRPNIKGVEEFEGKGISYCAICDGFFYRNKNLAVIGSGNYAISEAEELKNIASKLTILTNGEENYPENEFEVDTRKITEIIGENKVTGVKFEDGTTLDLDGLFIAIGVAGGSDFAKKIGVIASGDSLNVDENMTTNVPGIYACGNLTGGLLQVNKAAYEGAKAGLAVVNYIRNL